MLLLAASGIAIVALGQAQTTRQLSSRLEWLAPHAAQVTDFYPQPQPVIAAMVLLAVGALIFAVASWGWADREAEGATLDSPGRGFGLRIRADALPILAGLLAAVPMLVVVLRLYNDDYSHYLIPVWLVALGLAAVPFAARDLRPLQRPHLQWSWWFAAEALFVVAMMAMFIVLNLHDLTNWRFSSQGDEYTFYAKAKQIADGEPFNLFSQEGADHQYPVLSAAYQAIFIKLSAGDLFAWKLSMVAAVVVTLIPFYLLVRQLFGWRAAMFATALLPPSHYLLAFAHTGFSLLDALFPTVVAIWLLVVGLRRDSSLALFGSGAAAGLGFYTTYASRAAIIIIVIYLISLGWRALRPEKLLPVALAFALMVGPTFALHGVDVINPMLNKAEEGNQTATARVERVAHNIVPSIMAFNYSPNASRYTSGSLLDPLSAVLFALGLGLTITKVKHPSFRLLLVWWIVGVGVTGVANPRAEVAITRMYYVLPPVAAMAGLALERALMPALALSKRPGVQAAMATGALSLLMVPILYLNLHRFWYESPRLQGTSYEATIVRAVMSDECKAEPKPAIVVTRYYTGLIGYIFGVYQMGDRRPTVLSYDAALSPEGHLADGKWAGCIIIDPHEEDPTVVSNLLAALRALYPQKENYLVADTNGVYQVPVFR